MDAILRILSHSEFLFLGTESWGRRQNLLEGRSSLKGSLVLSQEIARDLLFEDNFKKLDVTSVDSPAVKVNPWLAQFWETRMKCYLDKSFM
jgi:hypothetical protein